MALCLAHGAAAFPVLFGDRSDEPPSQLVRVTPEQLIVSVEQMTNLTALQEELAVARTQRDQAVRLVGAQETAKEQAMTNLATLQEELAVAHRAATVAAATMAPSAPARPSSGEAGANEYESQLSREGANYTHDALNEEILRYSIAAVFAFLCGAASVFALNGSTGKQLDLFRAHEQKELAALYDDMNARISAQEEMRRQLQEKHERQASQLIEHQAEMSASETAARSEVSALNAELASARADASEQKRIATDALAEQISTLSAEGERSLASLNQRHEAEREHMRAKSRTKLQHAEKQSEFRQATLQRELLEQAEVLGTELRIEK